MAIRRILTVDSPADTAVLKQISKPVEGVDDGLRALMDDMLQTMYDAPGIGLAAVQIGEPVRVIVMDLGDREGTDEADESPEAEAKRRNPRPTRLSGHISPKNGVGDRLFGTAGATAVWGVTESLGKGGGNFC